MTGTAVKNLQLLEDICENENLKNVLLVTTFWDLVPKIIGERREKELASNFWKPLVDLGSRMYRYYYKSSGEELMWDIMNHQSNIIKLQLQIQLTEAERTLLDTMAGKRLQEGLNHQLEQLEMTLNQVQGEQTASQARRDPSRANAVVRNAAYESRINEEIATIRRDLALLKVPRHYAMQEIDNKVAEIAAQRGMDDIQAFWEIYGAGDREDGGDISSVRDSFSALNLGQPVSPVRPGYPPVGYGDEKLGRANKPERRKQKEGTTDTSNYRSFDTPQVEEEDGSVGA